MLQLPKLKSFNNKNTISNFQHTSILCDRNTVIAQATTTEDPECPETMLLWAL